jgi:hypothetical protein
MLIIFCVLRFIFFKKIEVRRNILELRRFSLYCNRSCCL